MGHEHTDPRDGSWRYEIRVRGRLDDRWAALLDGFSLTHTADGTTVVSGVAVDQAALHGVLRTLGDVGLALVSVTSVDVPEAARTTHPS